MAEIMVNWILRKIRREHIHMPPIISGDLELLELYSYRHAWANGDGVILPGLLFQGVYDLIPKALMDNHITVLVRCYKRFSIYLTFSDGNCWWCEAYREDPLRIDESGRLYHFDGGMTHPDGLRVIGVETVINELFGDDWKKHPPYEEQALPFHTWCEAHDAYYYARPHEYFNQEEAVKLACQAGNKVLVLEDLS